MIFVNLPLIYKEKGGLAAALLLRGEWDQLVLARYRKLTI